MKKRTCSNSHCLNTNITFGFCSTRLEHLFQLLLCENTAKLKIWSCMFASSRYLITWILNKLLKMPPKLLFLSKHEEMYTNYMTTYVFSNICNVPDHSESQSEQRDLWPMPKVTIVAVIPWSCDQNLSTYPAYTYQCRGGCNFLPLTWLSPIYVILPLLPYLAGQQANPKLCGSPSYLLS